MPITTYPELHMCIHTAEFFNVIGTLKASEPWSGDLATQASIYTPPSRNRDTEFAKFNGCVAFLRDSDSYVCNFVSLLFFAFLCPDPSGALTLTKSKSTISDIQQSQPFLRVGLCCL